MKTYIISFNLVLVAHDENGVGRSARKFNSIDAFLWSRLKKLFGNKLLYGFRSSRKTDDRLEMRTPVTLTGIKARPRVESWLRNAMFENIPLKWDVLDGVEKRIVFKEIKEFTV